MLREISLILHVLGVLLWIGGCASAAWTAAQLYAASAEARKEGLLAVRRSLMVIATPGLLLAWVGGLTIFVTGIEIYRRAGWMHTKITLALVVAALHGVLLARVRKAASGQREATPQLFSGLAMTIVLLAAVVVVLVVLRPGA
jgi:protoporphyrinogen IX oxidase